jgi:hypothetical protein
MGSNDRHRLLASSAADAEVDAFALGLAQFLEIPVPVCHILLLSKKAVEGTHAKGLAAGNAMRSAAQRGPSPMLEKDPSAVSWLQAQFRPCCRSAMTSDAPIPAPVTHREPMPGD